MADKAKKDQSTQTCLCRDCFIWQEPGQRRCIKCNSTRLVNHPELRQLSVAHVDCDAFYAAIEKRDNPDLKSKPVIVGGGKRGVVSTCCYIARIHGVRSAMPMFKALKACPNATIIRPNMQKYAAVGRQIRIMMQDLTPAVEPLSIDEAFLDMGGTERLHKAPPAESLARLAKRIEDELHLTVSIGLSYNKFLAKVASDLDKPRGFAVLGQAEAQDFLASKPVAMIWGVGRELNRQLQKDGISHISQLQAIDMDTLIKRYGIMGRRLYHFSRGEDSRHITPDSKAKSISNETTFESDIVDHQHLLEKLWPLSESVSRRLKSKGLAGRTVTLKLKTARHKILTRSTTPDYPVQMARDIYDIGGLLMRKMPNGQAYRLLGIGVSGLETANGETGDLLNPQRNKILKAEQAMDALEARFGKGTIKTGRSLKA